MKIYAYIKRDNHKVKTAGANDKLEIDIFVGELGSEVKIANISVTNEKQADFNQYVLKINDIQNQIIRE